MTFDCMLYKHANIYEYVTEERLAGIPAMLPCAAEMYRLTLLLLCAAGHALFRRAEAEVLPAAHPISLAQQQLH